MNAKALSTGPNPRRAGRLGRPRLVLLAAVTAAFLLVPAGQAAASNPLHVELSGTGSGEVSSVPAGVLECNNLGNPGGPGTGVCQYDPPLSEYFTMLATPEAHSKFVEWEIEANGGAGILSGCTTGPECELELFGEVASGEPYATAKFDLITHTLGVTEVGSGTVECREGAGAYGSCGGTFNEGHEVGVKATPAAHWSFAGFSAGSGSASGCTASPCTFVIEEVSTLTANFDANRTCANDPALCPPGTARARRTALVRGNRASLKLTCIGRGACRGSLKLIAKVRRGKRTRTKVIGRASFRLAGGASKTIRVRITDRQVRKALGKGRTVRARLGGSSIKSRTVRLKRRRR